MALEHVNDGGSNYGRIYCDLYGVIDQPDPGTFSVTITATDTTDDRINISQTYSFKVEEDIRYSRNEDKTYIHSGTWTDGYALFDGVLIASWWPEKQLSVTKTINGIKWKFTRHTEISDSRWHDNALI